MYYLVLIDLIRGMDWLSKTHAIVDCNKRKVYRARDIKIGKKLFFRGGYKVYRAIDNQPLLISPDLDLP